MIRERPPKNCVKTGVTHMLSRCGVVPIAGLLVLATSCAGPRRRTASQVRPAWELVLERRAERVMGITFSADGRFAKFLGPDGVLEVWDLRKRRRILREEKVEHAFWQRDGKTLRVRKARARLYCVPSEDKRWSLPIVKDRVICDNHSYWEVTREPDGSLVLWDTRHGKRAGKLPLPGGKGASTGGGPAAGIVGELHMTSSDPVRVVAKGRDGWLTVWPAESPGKAMRIGPHVRTAYHTLFSRDLSRVLTRGRHRASTWDARTGKFLAKLGPEPTYRTYRPRRGKPRRAAVYSEECEFRKAIFSGAGGRVVTVGSSVRLWETNTGKRLAELEPEALRKVGTIREMKLAPDGRTLFIRQGRIREPGRVWFWDLTTGNIRAEARTDYWHFDDIIRPTQVIIFKRRGAEVRAMNGGRLLQRLEGAGIKGHSYWSSDGKRLILFDSSSDGRLSLWSLETGRCLGRYEGWLCASKGRSFEVFGAAGGRRDVVRVVDWKSGKVRAKLRSGHSLGGPWTGTKDRSRILTTSLSGKVALWDATNERVLVKFQAHDGKIAEVRMAADCRTIVTRGKEDGKMRLWQPRRRR